MSTTVDVSTLSPDQIAALIAAHQRNLDAKKDLAKNLLIRVEAEMAEINQRMAILTHMQAACRAEIGIVQPASAAKPTGRKSFGGSGIKIEIDGHIYNSPTQAAQTITGTNSAIDGVRWFGITGTETDGQIIERIYTPRGQASRTIRAIVRR